MNICCKFHDNLSNGCSGSKLQKPTSPKSVRYIIWGPWMSVKTLIAISQIPVKTVQSWKSKKSVYWIWGTDMTELYVYPSRWYFQPVSWACLTSSWSLRSPWVPNMWPGSWAPAWTGWRGCWTPWWALRSWRWRRQMEKVRRRRRRKWSWLDELLHKLHISLSLHMSKSM